MKMRKLRVSLYGGVRFGGASKGLLFGGRATPFWGVPAALLGSAPDGAYGERRF